MKDEQPALEVIQNVHDHFTRCCSWGVLLKQEKATIVSDRSEDEHNTTCAKLATVNSQLLLSTQAGQNA